MRQIKVVLIFVFIILSGWSCNDKNKIKIIPEGKLKEILIDIQLADAYYMMHSNQLRIARDSNDFFGQIFEKNGVTKAQFDSSISYYSKNKPKKFEQLYDDVLTELNRMSSEINIMRTLILDSAANLFKGRTKFKLTGMGFEEKLPFELTVKDTGLYEIYVQIQIFSDDQSKNIRLTALNSCKDCKINRNDYFEKVSYIKTSQVKLYQISKRVTSKKKNIIRGWILDQDEQNRKFLRHININLFYIKKVTVQNKPYKFLGHKRNNN